MKNLIIFILVLFFQNLFGQTNFTCQNLGIGTINPINTTNFCELYTMKSLPTIGCKNNLKYAPVISFTTPIKTLRLVFHIIQKDDGSRNFQNTPTDLLKLKQIEIDVNNLLANLAIVTPKLTNCIPIQIKDSRIRVNIQEIIFHKSTDFWDKSNNNEPTPYTGCDVFEKFAKTSNNSLDNSLHIIIMGARKVGSDVSFSISGYASGVPSNMKKYMILSGLYNKTVESPDPFWLQNNNVAKFLGHELGHCMGLYHTFMDDYCCDTFDQIEETNNLMDYSVERETLTEQQLARCHYILENNCDEDGKCSDIYKIVSTNYCVKDDKNTVSINGISEWSVPKKINTDIILKTGAQLTIKCRVELAENVTITVERGAKLIIDGGILTNANSCKNIAWQGIYVWGNSKKQQPDPLGKLAADEAGVVILKNNAIVEHARTAISTSAPSIKWPQYADYYGGVIYAEGSSFVNNTRAIEFMSYKYPNKSKFINCTFKEEKDWRDNTIGVTIWDCHQIDFKGNTFESLDFSGIMGIDFDANVIEENIFKKLYYGIESYSTSPSSSKLLVHGNIFENNFLDIASLATAKDEGLQISSNYFKSSPIGITMQGPTSYRIRSNQFKNSAIGAISYETGEYQNRFICNDFQVQYGIGFAGNNNHSQFLQNEFKSTFDVVINATKNGKGSINTFQGDSKSAASNCFTPTGSCITADLKSSDWFFYFAPDKKSGGCYIPTDNITDGGGNNYEYKADGETVTNCDANKPTNLTDSDIEIIRTRNPTFTNPPTYTEDYTIQTEIGKQIDANNLVIASELIHSYQSNTEDAVQFRNIQRINIERLSSESEYVLSDADFFKLRNYADADLPSSAYAKSLLLLLKGERFQFPTANFNVSRGRQLLAQNRNNPNEISNVILAPNPNDGYFRLSLNRQRIVNGVFSLIDLFGRVVYSQKIHSLGYEDFSIDVSNFPSGLYHAKLIDGDTFSWEAKVLIKTY
jgi:hypothetical protein